MPDQNDVQNQPNAPQFNQDQYIADKHMPFVGQVNQQVPQPQSYSSDTSTQQVGVNPQSQYQEAPSYYNTSPSPMQSPQPAQPQAPFPQQQIPTQNSIPQVSLENQQYLNPNNFQSVLQNNQPQAEIEPTTATSEIPDPTIPPMPIQYSETVMKPKEEKGDLSKYEVLRLIVYAVPVFAIFILMLKSIDDEDVMWHVRQSLVAQGVWFAVLIVLTLIDAPIISFYGSKLWSIVCYGALIIAGIQAYNGERFRIKILYEIGKEFIEDKK